MAREDIQLEAGWKAVLADEFDKAYFQQIRYLLLAAKRDGKVIFPPAARYSMAI